MDKKTFLNFKDEDLTWAEKEFINVELGDKRLNQRLISITQAFLAHPEATIPQAMGDWAKSKATYRFFDNSKVSFEKIVQAHKEATRERITESCVILAIQDTSFIDYTGHPSTKDLGFLNDENHRGFLIHPTLMISTHGIPLGLVDLQIMTRDCIGIKEHRHSKSIEEKESRKWLQSYRATATFGRQHPDKQIINIADRESDIYEFFQEAVTHKATYAHAPDILIRAAWNRKLQAKQNIWPYMESKSIAGTIDIEVPRTKDHSSRKTTLTVRYAKITLTPTHRSNQKLEPLSLWAVYVQEQQSPHGIEPISWMLLTTVDITDFSKALEIVRWYICRWLIELYFKILKSGCQIEERQLETAHRLKNCLAVDCVVAWRILFLTMIGRDHPTLPVSIILQESEWRALYTFAQKKPYTSDSIPSLGDSIREIGKLGGFLNRKSDGHPGIICIWRGMWRLADITAAWKIFNPS